MGLDYLRISFSHSSSKIIRHPPDRQPTQCRASAQFKAFHPGCQSFQIVFREKLPVGSGTADFDQIGGQLVEKPRTPPAIDQLSGNDRGMACWDCLLTERIAIHESSGDFVVGTEFRASGLRGALMERTAA